MSECNFRYLIVAAYVAALLSVACLLMQNSADDACGGRDNACYRATVGM